MVGFSLTYPIGVGTTARISGAATHASPTRQRSSVLGIACRTGSPRTQHNKPTMPIGRYQMASLVWCVARSSEVTAGAWKL